MSNKNQHYVLSYQHAIAEFGAELLATKVAMQILSVPRTSREYQMACRSHNVFVHRVKAFKQEEDQKNKQQAANVLVQLPTVE